MSDETPVDEIEQLKQERQDLAQENKILHYMVAALLKTAGGEVAVDKLTLAFLDGFPKFEIAQREDDKFIYVKFVPFDPALSTDFENILKN